MDVLSKKTNLLFLTVIHVPTFTFIVSLGKQLLKIPFHIKFKKALVSKKLYTGHCNHVDTLVYLPHKNSTYLHSFDDEPCKVEQINDVILAQYWYYMGKLHRENDKPAFMIFSHKSKKTTYKWYKHGSLHRDDDKPATIYDGVYDSNNQLIEYDRLEYSKNGKTHRENGPAIIDYDGSEQWYLNDQLHRLDGPAVRMYVQGETVVEYWERGFLIEK